MTDAPATPGVNRPRVTVLDVLRLLSELVAFAALALWGALAWPMPWSIVMGIGAPAIAILVWALFLSPKAVIRVVSPIRVVVELLIFASATIALWNLGYAWAGLAVGAFCIVIGLLVGLRNLR